MTDLPHSLYKDGMLIFSCSMKQIENFMRSLDKEYDYTDKGDIKSYLGIDVIEPCKGTFKLLQRISLKTLSKGLDISSSICAKNHLHPKRY
jgi:hypothetical protein